MIKENYTMDDYPFLEKCYNEGLICNSLWNRIIKEILKSQNLERK